MKLKQVFFIISLAFLVSNINSCSKYQDGPFLSFKSKEKRLVNTWKHVAFINLNINETVTTNLPATTYTFSKGGDCSLSTGYTGTWAFTDEINLTLTLKKNNVDSVMVFEILKLASKELWLKNNNIEWQMKPAN